MQPVGLKAKKDLPPARILESKNTHEAQLSVQAFKPCKRGFLATSHSAMACWSKWSLGWG